MPAKSQMADRIRAKALEIGFDVVGIAAAGASSRRGAFHSWIGEGMQAGMAWMARDPDRRCDTNLVLPGAKSVVCVGVSYQVGEPPPGMWDDPLRGRIARYAWGKDYHHVMLPMLEELAQFVTAEAGPVALHRAYVDTGALLERDLGERAGMGFIGRNTLLIHPQWGSMVLLGELLTTADLAPDAPRPGTCGRCTRCLEACPTGAFPREHVLDARLCISYHTIENRGDVPEALRPKMGSWIFGCDQCQTVCPWVRKYGKAGAARWLAFDSDRCCPDLAELATLDDAAFRERFAGTPVLRAKRRGLLRNAAIALGNSRMEQAREPLQRLAADPEVLIASHAAWALTRMDEAQ